LLGRFPTVMVFMTAVYTRLFPIASENRRETAATGQLPVGRGVSAFSQGR
jgi:hypothetical protein